MIVLGLDTAAAGARACVFQDGKTLSLCAEAMERGQDARLVPLALEALDKAHLDFPALDRIVSLRGPGSFTGVRVGLATATGFGLAVEKPVFGVDRFSVHAVQQKAHQAPFAVLLDSRRDELFMKFYPDGGESAGQAPCLITAQDFMVAYASVAVTGDAKALLESTGASFCFLEPTEDEIVTACRLASEATEARAFPPMPLYLRAPDVTFPKEREGGPCCA